MGSYSDTNHSLPFLEDADIESAKSINESIIKALKEEHNSAYQGIIYGGFMATPDGIKVIEYNARFGDPEAMNILGLLETDFVEITKGITEGTLNKVHASFSHKASVCKYLVPEGYPNQSQKDFVVDISKVPASVDIFLGAVDEKANHLYATGSRTLALLSTADTILEAEKIVENAVQFVKGCLLYTSPSPRDS